MVVDPSDGPPTLRQNLSIDTVDGDMVVVSACMYISTEPKKNFEKNGNVFRSPMAICSNYWAQSIEVGLIVTLTKISASLTPTLIQPINLIIDSDHFLT